jgi:hypothetical protein
MVDDEDYELVLAVSKSWYKNDDGYARATVNGSGIRMHRIILNAQNGQQIDHCNCNPLDNRRANLRSCTQRQNSQNARPRGGISKYKGVVWMAQKKKWRSQIKVNARRTHLGYFVEEQAAAVAYDEAARHYFGEFARTNADSYGRY